MQNKTKPNEDVQETKKDVVSSCVSEQSEVSWTLSLEEKKDSIRTGPDQTRPDQQSKAMTNAIKLKAMLAKVVERR